MPHDVAQHDRRGRDLWRRRHGGSPAAHRGDDYERASHTREQRTRSALAHNRGRHFVRDVPLMTRLLLAAALAIGTLATTAAADPKPPPTAKSPPDVPQAPAVGANLALTSTSWPKMDWLYDAPSAKDAAGKVVVHWFCAAKLTGCADDLARLIALRDAGRVYIIAYVNGTKADAKKLDPIRDSEGVGRGTVAYGKGVTQIMKTFGFVGPVSIVVGTDTRIAQVVTNGAADQLDARDKMVGTLVAGIKDFSVAKTARPPAPRGSRSTSSSWSTSRRGCATRTAPSRRR